MAESCNKLKTSNLFSSFVVISNRNRSALERELLCNNSLFVGQLYEDKSLALRACDLIFSTTDLQTVNYYTTIHALELIYFDSNCCVIIHCLEVSCTKINHSRVELIYFLNKNDVVCVL